MHNHWWEFEPLEGDRPIRLLHEALHTDIFWQLDVYWAQSAGVDPADELAELGARGRSIHWKDGPAIHGRPMMAVGRGKVAVPRILRMRTQPVDHIIELDECATDALEAARQSRIYLEALSGDGPVRDDRGIRFVASEAEPVRAEVQGVGTPDPLLCLVPEEFRAPFL